MANKDNIPASGKNEADDLEAINGIDSTTTEALHRIGIHRLSDLAQYTPQKLSQAINKYTDIKVSAKKIETENWIGQAKALLAPESPKEMLMVEDASEVKEPEAVSRSPQRNESIGFSVFFDSLRDEQGKQIWQTRIYHHDSGEEKILSGFDVTSWANWMLEQAKLPVAPVTIPTQTEGLAPSGFGALSPQIKIIDGLEILSVRVYEVEPVNGIPQPKKKLASEVSFRIKGVQADSLTEYQIPFQISVYTVDLINKTLNLVATEQGQLPTQVFNYTSRQELPLPEVGRYEFHSIVLLLPPYERMAYYQGPILTIVP